MGEKLGLKPRARVRSFASIGSEPAIMLTGPSYAAQKALKRAGMSVGDIDLFELNEAFAAVVLRFMQALDIDHNIMNVNGGAIALGHPLGMSGARLVTTAINQLHRSGGRYALCTMCIGVGQGIAMVVERV
jgi:acetyl-CoA C-acetyltransferase